MTAAGEPRSTARHRPRLPPITPGRAGGATELSSVAYAYLKSDNPGVDAVAKGVATAIAILAVAIAGFFAYPAVVFGTDADKVASSLNHVGGTGDNEVSNRWIACQPGDHADWRCGPYLVDSDWRGCWTARRGVHGTTALSGCIDLTDALGLRGPQYLD